ncbi:ankyrin repeat domain-containing protein [Enterobacter asburiae]|uniref:ankyrin repeat domain-containing protein n=1 Tax=Scandinavium sp. UTDF21-P1B TaxID=3446379 RepID=UPI00346EF9F4
MINNNTCKKLFSCIMFIIPLLYGSNSMAEKQNPSLNSVVGKGDILAVKELVEKGTNIETRDIYNRTPLMIATRMNNVAIASYLIEKGADVNAKDIIQDTPYLYAGARGFDKILALTLAHGADLKSLNRYGGTALIPAAERGSVETVKILIDAGVNVNHINKLGWTALMEAIILGDGSRSYQQIISLLIKSGADVNIKDFSGKSPLILSENKGFVEISKLLIEAGAQR